MSIIQEFPIEHPRERTIISWEGGESCLFDEEAKSKVEAILERHDLSEELEIVNSEDLGVYLIVDSETEGEEVYIELNLDDESRFDVPEDTSSDFILELLQFLHRLYGFDEEENEFLIDAARKNHAIFIDYETDGVVWGWDDLRELLEM